MRGLELGAYIVRQLNGDKRAESHTLEIEKRLDQRSRLSIVTEVEHQINCGLSGFEGRKGNLWFHHCLHI